MIGRKIGHYHLLERIGSGGMGVVYRARDERLERDVVIKVLPEETVADPVARARLMREARSAAALNHPRVCTIHEVGEDDGQVFIAMEWVEGRPLTELIGSAGMPPSTVLRYGVEIADGLAHAHGRNVIHRDLKSANVMVTSEGHIKVLDFGLARRVRAADATTVVAPSLSLTESGAIVGTPHYMSPEVLHGAEADARSDVWALGVLLHEMTSGELPFAGQTAFEVAAAIMHAAPGPLPATVPAGLRAVIGRCLEKEPAHRYARAGEVRAALEALQSDPGPLLKPIAVESASKRARSLAARPRPALLTGIAAALAVALVALWLVNPGGAIPGAGCGGAAPLRSLAVLPLSNLSGDPQQDYFADGMTEELITSLTKISALLVISMSSVKELRAQNRPLREIGRALGVAFILRGSVTHMGDRIRINAQLIDAATNRNLWAESYERGLKDALALQSEVALAIAREIQVKLTPQEEASLTAVRVVDPRAHQAYLLGRFELGRMTEEGVQRAIGHFERAINIDPGYAVAYAALAEGYYFLSNVVLPPDQAMPLMRASALKALELDGNLAVAHTMLALVTVAYEFKWAEGDSSFHRAIRLNPGDATAHHWYGYWLMPRGRFAEADRELQRALELDPLTAGTQWHATWPSFYRGDYPQTVTALEALRERNPADQSIYSLLGETFEQMGRYDEAIAQLRKSLELGGHPWVLAAIGRVHARAGRRDSAEVVLGRLEQLARSTYVTPYGVASIHAAMGDKDRAFGLLERAFSEHSEDLVLLKIDPRFTPLRSDPRFAAVLRRMGLANS